MCEQKEMLKSTDWPACDLNIVYYDMNLGSVITSV